jgi:hypothetical protein
MLEKLIAQPSYTGAPDIMKRMMFEKVFAASRKQASLAALEEVRTGATAEALDKLKAAMSATP